MKFAVSTLLACTLLLSGCALKPAAIGNHPYIYEGYKDELAKIGLQEVRSLPYFTKPHVVVGQNNKGEQFAVLFDPSGVVDVIQLALPYERIIEKLQAYDPEIKSDVGIANIHLFQMNGKMVWSHSSAGGVLYLNDKGEHLDNPWKREHEGLVTKDNDQDFVKFYLNAYSNIPDWVHVVQYTPDGKPLNHILASKGNGFEYTYDNPNDPSGSPVKIICTCEGINHKEYNDRTEYSLRNCSDPIGASFLFTVKKP